MQQKIKVKAKEKEKGKEKAKIAKAKVKAEANLKALVKTKMNNDRSKIVVIGWKRALALVAGNAATIMILTKRELVGGDHTVPTDQAPPGLNRKGESPARGTR